MPSVCLATTGPGELAEELDVEVDVDHPVDDVEDGEAEGEDDPGDLVHPPGLGPRGTVFAQHDVAVHLAVHLHHKNNEKSRSVSVRGRDRGEEREGGKEERGGEREERERGRERREG